jgi:hypothetical protein
MELRYLRWLANSIKQINPFSHTSLLIICELVKMNKGKSVSGLIMIILSFIGFGLTYDVYVVLDHWSNLPSGTDLHDVGSGLLVILPLLLVIFGLMFLLIGLALLFDNLTHPN